MFQRVNGVVAISRDMVWEENSRWSETNGRFLQSGLRIASHMRDGVIMRIAWKGLQWESAVQEVNLGGDVPPTSGFYGVNKVYIKTKDLSASIKIVENNSSGLQNKKSTNASSRPR